MLASSSTYMQSSPMFNYPLRYFSVTRKYTRSHEWIDFDDDNKIGTVGITEYAANSMGNVTQVDLPTPGKTYEKGQTIAGLESSTHPAHIFAMSACTIDAVNAEIEG